MENKNVLGVLLSLLTFSALSFTTMALAAEDCSKKTSDPEVFTCAENNRNVAEKQLNSAYADAKKRIDEVFSQDADIKKQYLAVFLDSQRSWLKYRDTQCQLVAHVADKNSNPYQVFTNDCIAKLDEERTKQLKEIPYD